MKTVKLDKRLYDQWIDTINADRKSRGLGKWRSDATENMFLFLSTVITCNFYKHRTGYANRSKNKQIDSNPFLLCNGKIIYQIDYSDMPILLSTAAHNILISDGGREKLGKMGLITMKLLPRNHVYQNEFYYELTAKGKELLPEKFELAPVESKKQCKKLRKFLLEQNNLNQNTYKRLIKGLTDYEFKLPPKNIFIQRHLKDYEDDDKEYKREPAEMLEVMYKQMQQFNSAKEEHFLFQCSSDCRTWGGRFYAIPSFIKSFCRRYLRHRKTKKSLVELDIQNSQFHVLNAVLKQYFPNDYDQQFDADLQSGKCLYRTIGSDVFNKPIISDSERNEVKGEMFHSFFKGKFELTSKTTEKEAQVLQVINQKYPKLVKLVGRLQKRKIPYFYDRALPYYFDRLTKGSKQYKKVLKKNQHRKVSFSTTLKETEIMSELWNRLYKQECSFVGVHDALLIEPNNLETVRNTFQQVLDEYMGYVPVLREEQLSLPTDESGLNNSDHTSQTVSYTPKQEDRCASTESVNHSQEVKRVKTGPFSPPNRLNLRKTEYSKVNLSHKTQCLQSLSTPRAKTSTLPTKYPQNRIEHTRRGRIKLKRIRAWIKQYGSSVANMGE